MADIEKKTSAIPADLTDEEWSRIQPFLPGAAKTGRRVVTDLREVLNAIRYMARSDGGWAHAVKGFPAHIGRGRDALRTRPRTAPTGWNVPRPDGEAAGDDQGAEHRIRQLEAEYEHANELAADVDELLPGGGYGRTYCRIFDEVGHETQRYQNDRVVLQ